jgi:hypothetical protein
MSEAAKAAARDIVKAMDSGSWKIAGMKFTP